MTFMTRNRGITKKCQPRLPETTALMHGPTGTTGGLVPLFVRSLALAIPPFKVIDIHTGRPLGLANKTLASLIPPDDTEAHPHRARKPSQHSTVFLVFEIFAECCDGLGDWLAAQCDKGGRHLTHSVRVAGIEPRLFMRHWSDNLDRRNHA